MKHHLAMTHAHCVLHIHGIPPADANSTFCYRCLSYCIWFKMRINLSTCSIQTVYRSTICILLVAAHRNFPLQTEKWKSSTKQLTWLNPTSYWLTPWMKKLRLLSPLCPAFVWQKTGDTGEPAAWREPVALTSFFFLNNIGKMRTKEVVRRVGGASGFPILQSNSFLLLDSAYDFVFSRSFFEQYSSLSVFYFPSFYVRTVLCSHIHAWKAYLKLHKC